MVLNSETWIRKVEIGIPWAGDELHIMLSFEHALICLETLQFFASEGIKASTFFPIFGM